RPGRASAMPETAARLAAAPPLRIAFVMCPPIQHRLIPHLPVLAVLLALLGWVPAARAAPVDLELVLAIDSSASVDYNEFNRQLEGLAYAFRDPDLVAAIGNGAVGAIAVTLMEWAGAGRQEVVVPWTRIADEADAAAFADRLDRSPRYIQTGATSISSAIRAANA